jgi:uncharacterized protein GlcG (DUF336 family)
MKTRMQLTLGVFLLTSTASARGQGQGSKRAGLPTEAQLKIHLTAAPASGGNAEGLFSGRGMWAAVVSRDGEPCPVAANQNDVTQRWPGSEQIAKSKAYTANAFSLDSPALSTARLYTSTQPGHSLWSLGSYSPSRDGRASKSSADRLRRGRAVHRHLPQRDEDRRKSAGDRLLSGQAGE